MAQKKKYVVFKARIMDDDGKTHDHDDVVELTSKLAKHYNSLGFLRPYMEDTADGEVDIEDDDDGSDAAPVQSTRVRRPVVPATPTE